VLSPSQSPQQPAAFRCPHPGPDLNHAMIESFWSRMQIELLDRHRWRTRIELANAIFEYLEIFHNRQRRHSSLGMLSPIEFETRQPTTVA
jgi:putative transposase